MKKVIFLLLLGAFVMLNVVLSITTSLDNSHFNLKNVYAQSSSGYEDSVTVKPGQTGKDCKFTVWICNGNDECWEEEVSGRRIGCTEQGGGCSPTECSM